MNDHHVLTIRIDSSKPNYPKVRLLIDGSDLLATTGNDEGNDPADILDTGALIPTKPSRRIALYGCGCGIFGCANVAMLVHRVGDTVQWSDAQSLTGAYEAALPNDGDEEPDPAVDYDLPSQPLAVPLLTFSASQYNDEVARAMADRTWETHLRAVMRHLLALKPEWMMHATGPATFTLDYPQGRRWGLTELEVPSGEPAYLAQALVDLFDQGVRPGQIIQEALWQ
ncbi:hypothetical protein [Nocardioides aurantiacus]|uniref:Uncharacterized protein n=1 Tax=Nocardioides aurantiacus TaxID=86796 RepID=A0A3N2CTU1_9ACTN|nr:hypothetical protein [Nocardioides aurantiacus]ROR90963.1 hypothetical protein EDD33_1820 [Nocardioides aurantiacus]